MTKNLESTSLARSRVLRRKPKEQSWTSKEVEEGRQLLAYISKRIDTHQISDFFAQISIAARAHGLLSSNQTFKDLPKPLKRYLAATNKKRKEPVRDEVLFEEIEHNLLVDAAREWLEGGNELQPDEADAIAHLDQLYRDGTMAKVLGRGASSQKIHRP